MVAKRRDAPFMLRMSSAHHRSLMERCDLTLRSVNSEVNMAVSSWLQGNLPITDVEHLSGEEKCSVRFIGSLRDDVKSRGASLGTSMNTLMLCATAWWLEQPTTQSLNRKSNPKDVDDYRIIHISTGLYDRIARGSPKTSVERAAVALLESAFPEDGDPARELQHLIEEAVMLKRSVTQAAAQHLDALLNICLSHAGSHSTSKQQAIEQLRSAIVRYSLGGEDVAATGVSKVNQ